MNSSPPSHNQPSLGLARNNSNGDELSSRGLTTDEQLVNSRFCNFKSGLTKISKQLLTLIISCLQTLFTVYFTNMAFPSLNRPCQWSTAVLLFLQVLAIQRSFLCLEHFPRPATFHRLGWSSPILLVAVSNWLSSTQAEHNHT